MIRSTLKIKKIPNFFLKTPFEKIKKEILGSKYDLSIVLIGKKLAQKLNSKYRNKNYAADVLSFKISDLEGEIFVCPEVAKNKASHFFDPTTLKKIPKIISFENYLILLVIHGIFHLKGLNHGAKMNSYELAHYSRYRHRDA